MYSYHYQNKAKLSIGAENFNDSANDVDDDEDDNDDDDDNDDNDNATYLLQSKAYLVLNCLHWYRELFNFTSSIDSICTR